MPYTPPQLRVTSRIYLTTFDGNGNLSTRVMTGHGSHIDLAEGHPEPREVMSHTCNKIQAQPCR